MDNSCMVSTGELGKRRRDSPDEGNASFVSSTIDETVPSDTELIIQSVQQSAPRLHGFVFLHQVYSLLSNRTLVDDDINHLRLNLKTYKVLQCDFSKSGGSANKYANAMVLINTEEYIRSLTKFITDENCDASSSLRQNFAYWLRSSGQISVLRKELTTPTYYCVAGDVQLSCSLSNKDVDRLISYGFLHYRNDGDVDSNSASSATGGQDGENDLFWLSHPTKRPLVLCMQTAEQEIVAQIRKTRYRELSEKKLQRMCVQTADASQQNATGKGSAKKGLLSSSPFPLSYHLLDLVGRNVIYKVAAPATSDFILRLVT